MLFPLAMPHVDVWVRRVWRRVLFAELPDGRLWWSLDNDDQLEASLTREEIEDIDGKVFLEVRHRQAMWREATEKRRSRPGLRVVGGDAA